MDFHDGSLERLLRAILKIFKAEMKTGIPGVMPVLDPLKIGSFNFSGAVDEKLIQAKANFADVVVDGLSTFDIPKVDVNPQNLKASAVLTVKNLGCSGQYKLNGTAVYVVPISGNGGFSMNADAVKATISLQLHMVNENQLGIKVDVEEISFDASTLTVHFDNLEGGGDLGKYLNEILNVFALKIFHLIEPMLAGKVKTALQELTDYLLKDIPFPINEEALSQLPETHPFRSALYHPYHLPELVQADSAQSINLNTLFDKIIANVDHLLVKEGYDPWDIPGQAEVSFKKWIFSGGAKFYDASIAGLSSIVRTGNVTLSPATKTVALNIGLSSTATGGGNWEAWFKPIDIHGHAGVEISNLQVSATLKLKDDGHAQIETFQLATSPDISVSISGLGPHDWILDLFTNAIIGFLTPFLNTIVMPKLKSLLQEELNKFKIPIP